MISDSVEIKDEWVPLLKSISARPHRNPTPTYWRRDSCQPSHTVLLKRWIVFNELEHVVLRLGKQRRLEQSWLAQQRSPLALLAM